MSQRAGALQLPIRRFLSVSLPPLFFLVHAVTAAPEPPDDAEIREAIQEFKKDPRGPYQAIRWFCPDGTMLPPQERCAGPGGIQHALAKDVVVRIREEHGVYLGQILAGTEFDEFLDAEHQGSRVKQYQMERFLQVVDDGWILRRARYYRGAVQAEDEDAWGRDFLRWLLAKDDFLTGQFFLARRLVKDFPHTDLVDDSTRIRTLARDLADAFPSFMDLRVKIHSRPDRSDVQRVRAFGRLHRAQMTPALVERLDELERSLTAFYRTTNGAELGRRYLSRLPASTAVGLELRKLMSLIGEDADVRAGASTGPDRSLADECTAIARLLWVIRKNLVSTPDPETRLDLLELSVEAESLLFQRLGEWRPGTLRELLQKNHVLAQAAAGAGFLEVWEWERLEPFFRLPPGQESLSVQAFQKRVESSHRAVEWGTGMVRAVYGSVVDTFSRFEPLASGFSDDLIRSSILLMLGEVADRMSAVVTRLTGLSNRVLDVGDQGRIRGLNPGVALGELEVMTGLTDGAELESDKIYVLLRAPADLRPIAGIATVSEGNAVSHVQLLARNLGIPNAVISHRVLEELALYSGRRVFYAVSPHGTVVMKPAEQMTEAEKALVSGPAGRRQQVTVPVDRLDLGFTDLLSLGDVRASDSGRICGPKAANLGELSALFPEMVPAGLVIPFGVFRRHLDQPMPGTGSTYADVMRELTAASDDQHSLLDRLSELHEAIRAIELAPELERSLKRRFRETFGDEMGEIPVFIRSDTNMEDLSDFTGAGLNRTVANIREEKEILQAIRDVWASAFTERSFRWRQRFLTNPRAVYPSVLLLPSVNVDKSGVMITSGLSSSNPQDVTVAFNWGGAGAVQGQLAETYLLRHDGADVLLSPAREAEYNVFLPNGGVGKAFVTFERPILSRPERLRLRALAADVRRLLPRSPGIESEGPFDVELGFRDDRIWLFQVRPFAENRRARSSAYLSSLDQALPRDAGIRLDERVDWP